jgi:acyl-CoA thioesterase I
MIRFMSCALAAALAFAAGSADAADSDSGVIPTVPTDCAVRPDLMAIGPALARGAARVEQREPLTIVAVGSSSTQGFGASAPDLSYPSRLDVELKERFPDIAIRVVNRGKGGEEVAQMLTRLERDVIAAHPDLVVWQLGTNAVLHHNDVAGEKELIERGVARFKEGGSDVVLMDMQYAPRVIARPAYAVMERMIANVAKSARIGLFRRFDIMRQWQAGQHDSAPKMIGPDGLHMTDRGYGCLAADLAEALAWNWWSHEHGALHLGAARIAGLGGAGHASARAGLPAE